MADKTLRRVAVLAIHPEHAQAIIEGRKRVEFRKRRLHPSIEHVVMYATAPTGKVVGFFRIASLDAASPTAIWDRYKHDGAIPRRLFRGYYSGARLAVAWVIDHVTALGSPLPLRRIHPDAFPPQSFAYLPEQRIEVACDEWRTHVRPTESGSPLHLPA